MSQIPRRITGHKINKSQRYTMLIHEISDHHPQLEQAINKSINQDMRRHIYTLRHGDLEAYLGLKDK